VEAVEDVDSVDWSDFRKPFRSGAVESGVTERLLVSFALRICESLLREVSSSAVIL
jgi:hypothetical protein